MNYEEYMDAFYKIRPYLKKNFNVYLSFTGGRRVGAHNDGPFRNFIPIMEELGNLYMNFEYHKGGNPYIQFDLNEYWEKKVLNPLKTGGYSWGATAYNQWYKKYKYTEEELEEYYKELGLKK